MFITCVLKFGANIRLFLFVQSFLVIKYMLFAFSPCFLTFHLQTVCISFTFQRDNIVFGCKNQGEFHCKLSLIFVLIKYDNNAMNLRLHHSWHSTTHWRHCSCFIVFDVYQSTFGSENHTSY